MESEFMVSTLPSAKVILVEIGYNSLAQVLVKAIAKVHCQGQRKCYYESWACAVRAAYSH